MAGKKPRWIICNRWQDFQHYHDRGVPWIKFYTRLTHDDAWLSLSAARRGMLVSIWLEYAQSSCKLRADTTSLSHRIEARFRQPDLDALVHAGFLSIRSSPDLEHVKIGSRPTRARRETERETERENPLPPSDQAPKPKHHDRNGAGEQDDLPSVSELDETQRADLAKRMAEIGKTIGP